jgi:hypothetical protein
MDKYADSSISEDEAKKLANNFLTIRKTKRSKVTRTLNSIDFLNVSNEDSKFYLDKLKSMRDDLNKVNEDTMNIMLSFEFWSTDEFESQSESCDSYDDDIRRAIVKLNNIVDSGNHATNTSGHDPKLLLPKIDLPKFDGTPETYDKFIASFETMVSRYKLSNFEKYSYLLKQLSGNAKSLIETLPVSELTFDAAKSLLDKAFCCKLDQQYAVLAKLSKIKLGPDSDPYKWICDARSLKDQFERLNIDSDLILQYFLWEGLNDNFKAQYVGILNQSKPNLSDILEHAFEANKRYKEFGNVPTKCKSEKSNNLNPPSTDKSLSLAVQVDTNKPKIKFYGCILCSSGSESNVTHKINQCPVFTDAAAKVKKLKELKACTKCGFTNHTNINCKFHFTQSCYKCKGWHYSYLCILPNVQNSSASGLSNTSKTSVGKKSMETKPEKKSTNQLVQFAVQNTEFNSVILPTFIAKIGTTKKRTKNIHGLLDSASQSSFIKTDLAIKLNLKIINRDITVTVYGFNEEKKYTTNLVELPLWIDNEHYKITAMCIPKIRTDICVPHISDVLLDFERKGYPLADSTLNDKSCSEVELLLGMDNSSILPFKSISFGNGNLHSIFLESPLGVMLVGDVKKMLPNLEFLPCFNQTSQ